VDEFCGPNDGGGPAGGGPAGGGGPVGGGGPPPVGGPPKGCGGDTAGKDPILLSNGSAVTEPFTDFSVEFATTLSMTRTYTSADASVGGGPIGWFGRGWHHELEAELACRDGVCTVSQGIHPGLRYSDPQPAVSLDGTETWLVYRPFGNIGPGPADGGLLAARPDGTYVLFMPNGRELQFQSVCDACPGAEVTDPHCMPVEAGGRARLVKIVDGQGRTTRLSYERSAGVLLEAADDLGHSLRLTTADACGTGFADELRFGERLVAKYLFQGYDLAKVTDGDGRSLREYAYDPLYGGLLFAVLNESGTPIAEFSYDGAGRATGLVDAESSV
jgi:hypothetical protein